MHMYLDYKINYQYVQMCTIEIIEEEQLCVKIHYVEYDENLTSGSQDLKY